MTSAKDITKSDALGLLRHSVESADEQVVILAHSVHLLFNNKVTNCFFHFLMLVVIIIALAVVEMAM